MHCSIGKQLGILLAQYEEDLYRGGDDVETLRKVALVLETYRNFTQANLPAFEGDFQSGYETELDELNETQEPRRDRGTLLDAYDKLQAPDLS